MPESPRTDRPDWSLRVVETFISELDKGPQGLEVLCRALQLFENVNINLHCQLEGDPPELLRVRNDAGTFHEVKFRDGVYEDYYQHCADSGTERFGGVETIAWHIAEQTIPRIFAGALDKAEREGTLLKGWKSGALGVSISAVSEVYLREFEQVGGVWIRRPDAVS
jgi:hypothetical protein